MSQQLVNGTVLGSVYLLFALGLTLSWGALNVLNLAHGAMLMFAAFTAYLVSISVSVPLPLLIVVAVLVGAAATLLLDVVVFRHIRRSVSDEHQAELLTLIAGIGAAGIPLTIAQVYTNDTPFGIPGVRVGDVSFAGVRISYIQIAIVGLAIGLCVALALWVGRSRTGRALRALAHDRETCKLMGISPTRMAALTMGLAGGLAGLAGVLLMLYLGALSPGTGDALLLKGFAVVILGGVGSIWGTLAGAVVVAAGETVLIATTSGTLTEAVSFAVILIMILVRPTGLFSQGKVERV